jgi:hypothetical protein
MDAVSPRRAALPVALALGLMVGGCDLFRPEVPPPPSGNAVVEDFASPTRLLSTLADAVANKGPSGQTAYANAFAESTAATTRAFYAFHWPAVVDNWRQLSQREPPNPWDLTLERNFYSYLVGVYETFDYTLVWDRDPGSPNDEIDDAAGTALLHRQYQLVASSTTTAEQKRIAVGFADLYLYRDTGRWFLYRWEDRIDPAIGVTPDDPDELSMGARRLDSQSNR